MPIIVLRWSRLLLFAAELKERLFGDPVIRSGTKREEEERGQQPRNATEGRTQWPETGLVSEAETREKNRNIHINPSFGLANTEPAESETESKYQSPKDTGLRAF